MNRILNAITVLLLISGAGAYDGKHFILAFPAGHNRASDGLCQIIINANTYTEVSISYGFTVDNLVVDIGSYIYDIDCSIRAQPGHSNKAVIVDSNIDITVQVYMMIGSIGDAYLAVPSTNAGAEYVIATPPEPCPDNDAATVYTLAAEAENTRISVYEPGPGGYQFLDTIYMNNAKSTYTATSISRYDDYTGLKFTSNAPITVISGSSCFNVGIGSCNKANAGYISSPSIDQAGKRFIVPKITKVNPGDSGAYIRVISFSPNNVIQIPDQSIQVTINAGRYYEHYIGTWDEITRVDCRETCMVVLYNELACYTGEGNFMLYVTPLERRTVFSRFTVMERTSASDLNNYLTVISETQNVRLDNAQVVGWRLVPGWLYYEVTLEIVHGVHILQSYDSGTFVAFVYGHQLGSHYGYGCSVVHSATDVPDITTLEPTTAITSASTTHVTTELPDFPGQVPNYRIVLISDWVSGEIMENDCVTQYYNQLRQTTVQMAVEVNDMIDVMLCSGLTTDDIIAESVSSSFFSFTNSGNALVTFTLRTEPHVLLNDILNCAKEIAEYATPHSTWGEPLLDPIQNCANPVFDEGVFYDGQHAWICVTEKEFEEYSTIPSYYVELEDVWTTHDGSEMNPECTLKYSLSLDQRAVSMRSQINSILGSQLCTGMSGFSVVSQVTSLVGQGSNILMHIDFILSYSSASGGDVLLCAEDILQYVKIYDNWGLPLLPSEPGCPELTQEGNEFDSTNNGWICNV